MYDIVALGELLIDFSVCSSDSTGYPTLAAHPGGAPCNFLAAAAKYGARTAFIGKVGDDVFGSLLQSTLDRAGIDTRGLVRDPDVFTTLAFVTLDQTGNRAFSFARKPGADTQLRPGEVDRALIDQTRAFHFGTLSLTDEPARSATREAVDYARSRGKLVTFDPNLRRPLWPSEQLAREQILWGLRQADVVKISEEEVEFLWSCGPEEGAERLLQEFGAALAMVTLGADGCLLRNQNGTCRAAPPPVRPVDTTGAGDIFGGTAVKLLLDLGGDGAALSREELASIARFASTAATLSTLRPGGIPSIPDREAVLAALPEDAAT